MNTEENKFGQKTSMAEEGFQAVSSAYDKTSQAVSDAYDKTSEVVSDAYDKTSQVMSSMVPPIVKTKNWSCEASRCHDCSFVNYALCRFTPT